MRRVGRGGGPKEAVFMVSFMVQLYCGSRHSGLFVRRCDGDSMPAFLRASGMETMLAFSRTASQGLLKTLDSIDHCIFGSL
jgi:hypothetical protein